MMAKSGVPNGINPLTIIRIPVTMIDIADEIKVQETVCLRIRELRTAAGIRAIDLANQGISPAV